MIELLYLLLPLAFYSGWRASGKFIRRFSGRERPLSGGFVKGVNFLLKEEPDKALDVFLNQPDIDPYTAETYLLLGNLFRNRGEVDRALSVHQNLAARASLSAEQKAETMLALGQDFLAAGMMDRAENVLNELLANDAQNVGALESLKSIYEQTADWDNALHVAKRLRQLGNQQMDSCIAHYHCELAQKELRAGHLHAAREILGRVAGIAPDSPRVLLLSAQSSLRQNKPDQALESYRRLLDKHPQRIMQCLDGLRQIFEQDTAGLKQYLRDLYLRTGNAKPLRALLSISDHTDSGNDGGSNNMRDADEDRLLRELFAHNTPDLRTLIAGTDQLAAQMSTQQDKETIRLFEAVIKKHLAAEPDHQCTHCGYKMHDALWQCPVCLNWDVVAER